MRLTFTLALATLLAVPGSTFAASREQQEMQRDIAQLQDQVRALQNGFDQKMAALQVLVQQAVDGANKANTTVSVLSAGVSETLDRVLRERLTPLAGLSAKLDNTTNDISEVRNSVADLNTQMNKIMQTLGDVNMALKVIQAPSAPPPPSAFGVPSAGTPGTATAAPPPAAAIYTNAVTDYNGGKFDLAASEFADFIRFYPDDPEAPKAQLYVGQSHYQQNKFEVAVKDFDAVLERYPDSKVTPTAYYEKGMALLKAGRRDAAVAEFRTVSTKYRTSDEAIRARDQLRTLGVSAAPPAALRKR